MRRFHHVITLCGIFCLLLFVPGCGRNPITLPPAIAPNVQPEQALPANKAFNRAAFRFDYPASWTVQADDKDYDPDHLFIINASPGAFVMFVVFDAELDPGAALSMNVDRQEKHMSGVTKTEFRQWGKYAGAGMKLQGKALGVSKSTFRVFAFNASERTFVVTELTPDREAEQLAPGFRVVEETFQVTK